MTSRVSSFILKLVSAAAFCGSLSLTSCQTAPRPLEDYIYARTALEAAKGADAAKHSPGFWNQAEEAYEKGQKSYQDREWENARKYFILSRKNAEKAENSARLKRAQSGEIL